MDATALQRLLEEVAAGAVSPTEAGARLRHLPFADLGFARVDHHRALRQGQPEVVYAPGKAPEHCAAIVSELLRVPGNGPVLLTRATPEQLQETMRLNPGGTVTETGPGLSLAAWRQAPSRDDRVLVVTAGTSDLPVARECSGTLEALGFSPRMIADCGVAGIHRILASVQELSEAAAVVVVAGMEGALASVVGGITPAPVVAVPTSAGYGASLGGVTAMLGMLACCAAGVTVVGIDNGFGAAAAISRILH